MSSDEYGFGYTKKDNVYPWEEEKITCPDCVGTGKDIDSLDKPCYTCYGTGRVTKTK